MESFEGYGCLLMKQKLARKEMVKLLNFSNTKTYMKVYRNDGKCQRRDGVVVRASASQSVDLGFISLVGSYQKTLKMASIASLLGA